MVMVYLIFALSIFFVRLFAGYDSRYQKGKYISIKNTVLSAVLLDGMSIYGRTRRLKKDKNKMSFSLSILSGEIGGGSTEAWICLGISVSVGL